MMGLFKTKSKVTVEEIHETFYTEVDRLLAESKIEVQPEDKTVVEKSLKLKSLGFGSSAPVKNAEKIEKKVSEIEADNREKESVKEAIKYFSDKYPLYKFITERSVKKICEKYGLIYGEVAHYIGDVPEKNIEHIERFKIKEEDECWSSLYTGSFSSRRFSKHLSFENVNKEIYDRIEMRKNGVDLDRFGHYDYIKTPLEIAAPPSDFDLNNMRVKDFKLSAIPAPDPVVLQPVFFKGMKHYLIVTAWGNEATDELVSNPKMN